MSLTRRQVWAYRDTVNVYRLSVTKTSGVINQPTYSATPVLTALTCRIESTQFRNTDTPPLGRTQDDNFFTEDELHCELGTDIKDTDVVKITTTGSPLLNKYFKVVGFGQTRQSFGNRTPNYTHIRLRLLDVAPPGL